MAEIPPPGQSRVVLENGKEVALFNIEGRLYAVGNRCPHRSGPLFKGTVERVSEEGRLAVRCPIHGWMFDLKTGECLTRPSASIPTFPVLCEGDHLSLGPQQGALTGPSAPGPAA